MSVTILGIESSCDDTSSSVIRDGVMLSNVIASQAVHEAYGGVVPELASRAHQQNIIPVVARPMCLPISSRKRRKTIMRLLSLSFACWCRVAIRKSSR